MAASAAGPDGDTTRGTVSSAEIARLAGVGRAAVSNWRRRHDDFPRPVGGTDTSPSFDLTEIRAWLERQGKLDRPLSVESVWQLMETVRGHLDIADAVAFVGAALLVATASGDVTDMSDAELDERIRLVFTRTGGPDAPDLPSVHSFRSTLTGIADLARADEDTPGTFERFYQRFLMSVSRQYPASPPELADLMVDLADRPGGTVFDPACGAATLLRTALLRGRDVHPVGQELSPGLARLGGIRLALAGADPHIQTGDSLRADAFPGLLADTVLVNPPFNQRDWGMAELEFDARWEYGLPAKGDSELAWIQHALAHTRPGGRVVAVLPPGVASRRTGRRIRAELLRRGALRAVIALPAGLAPPMGVPLMLWVLRRPVEGEPAPSAVLLVEAAHAEPDWPRVRDLVLAAYEPFASGRTDGAAPGPGRWRVLPVVDLLSEEVDLTPSRYVTRTEHDFSGLTRERNALASLAARLPDLLPEVEEAAAGSQATVTINDLMRRGQLELLHTPHRKRRDSEPGPDAPLAFSGADVVSGDPPSHPLPDDAEAVRVREGDVLVPRVLTRPAARVVTAAETGALAAGSVFVLRPDPAALDPWFLAGVLSGSEVARYSSGSLRRSFALDVRKVELPRLPLPEQQAYGAAFRRLAAFRRGLAEVARTGEEVGRTLTDGLIQGALRPTEPSTGGTGGTDTDLE